MQISWDPIVEISRSTLLLNVNVYFRQKTDHYYDRMYQTWNHVVTASGSNNCLNPICHCRGQGQKFLIGSNPKAFWYSCRII